VIAVCTLQTVTRIGSEAYFWKQSYLYTDFERLNKTLRLKSVKFPFYETVNKLLKMCYSACHNRAKTVTSCVETLVALPVHFQLLIQSFQGKFSCISYTIASSEDSH